VPLPSLNGVCVCVCVSAQATVERAARLARDYQRQLRDVYGPRAEALGDVLGLDAVFVAAYVEGEQQRSTQYLITKLCTLFRKVPCWNPVETPE
jgi:hypothetical protein